MIETCRVCGEPKSAHVATKEGPFTHPREARGEGTYRLVGSGSSGSFWPNQNETPWERWEFVPHNANLGAGI